MNRARIKRIESAGIRALPPLETVDVDGWTVNLGRGRVNRLNAAVTNGYRPRALMDQIEATERRFSARRRSPRFRLTDLDPTVDRLLDARGYVRSADVIVMTILLSDAFDVTPTSELIGAVTPRFLDKYQAWGGYDEVRRDEIGESMAQLTAPHVVALGPNAVAVGVSDDDLIGLFDVATDPEHRRQGHGRAVSLDVLTWGRHHGASEAYLQVHTENRAGRALYEGMGFEEAYRYWYRTRRTAPR
jgi:GNAT superfamily N-acetyltransferase